MLIPLPLPYQPNQTEQGNSRPLPLTLGDGLTGFGPGSRAHPPPVSLWFYGDFWFE